LHGWPVRVGAERADGTRTPAATEVALCAVQNAATVARSVVFLPVGAAIFYRAQR